MIASPQPAYFYGAGSYGTSSGIFSISMAESLDQEYLQSGALHFADNLMNVLVGATFTF